MTITDCELIYEATFLTAVASLENLLETFLIEMIWTRRGAVPGNKAIVSAPSRWAIRRVILLGRDYGEYMPLRKAIERAEIFLTHPVPFSNIPAADKELLTYSSIVRNAVAH